MTKSKLGDGNFN